MKIRVCRGLSLIELIVTISLAAILGVPVGILVSEHLGATMRARDATVAMTLARREMEQLDDFNSASLSSFNNFCHANLNLTGAGGVSVASPNPAYAITRIVLCQTPTSSCACSCSGICLTGAPSSARNDIKRIEVQVKRSGSSELLASLVTYRTKYVSFGPRVLAL